MSKLSSDTLLGDDDEEDEAVDVSVDDEEDAVDVDDGVDVDVVDGDGEGDEISEL